MAKPRRFGWPQAAVVVLAVTLAGLLVWRAGPQAPEQAASPEAPAATGGPSLIEATTPAGAGEVGDYAQVVPGAVLTFPRDHGAHPAYRIEWWYVTGWLEPDGGEPVGFQVTFFRARPGIDAANPSAFAAHQVLFAHAAISDPSAGRLVHDQRIARQGFGLAEAALGDADVAIDDWSLRRQGDGRFRTTIKGDGFDLRLVLTPTQPPLLQGQGGYSRKGPGPGQASYYYSLPQLSVSGDMRRGGRTRPVGGKAWMDREWSSSLLDPAAVGWDWTGINLDDGGALTAFQVRGADGRAIWAGGSWRSPEGALTTFAPGDVRFETVRTWRSPRTGATYPTAQAVEARIGGRVRRFALTPLFDDQELDSRASGGPVYWEGAVTTEGGRGYLELTGYVQPLKM